MSGHARIDGKYGQTRINLPYTITTSRRSLEFKRNILPTSNVLKVSMSIIERRERQYTLNKLDTDVFGLENMVELRKHS